MARTAFQSVDEYIASQPTGTQAALRIVRRAIRRAVPQAQELISYQIPAYKLDGRIVIYFAGWREHYSLYPAVGIDLGSLGAKLARHHVSKGTLRFELSEPVPVKLIERIVKLRAKAVAKRSKAKTGASR